jgi:hypothetical protein
MTDGEAQAHSHDPTCMGHVDPPASAAGARRRIDMHRTRLSLIGMVIVVLVAGLSGVVAAQAEEADPMVPATASIEIVSSQEISPGRMQSDEAGVVHIEGVHHEHIWESTDPRLSGTVTYRGNWQGYPDVPMQVESSTYEVVNEGGRWFGPATAQAGPSLGNSDTILLRGEGDYEGLMAYILIDGTTTFPPKIFAAIFPGEMPLVPERSPASE